jgi:cytochrome oxidase Cu insertion factor (SCO1/SenC/PrrC family)
MMSGRRQYVTALAAVLFCAVAALFAFGRTGTPVAEASSPWGKSYFPNVPVQDQDGETWAFYDDLLDGRVVVINFVYTACSSLCPLTTARLARIADRLGDRLGRDVFFYSISVDPERDFPEALKSFSSAFHDGPGWKFLTGRPDDMAKIYYALGNRSRELNGHMNDLILGNAGSGEWSRNSIFSEEDTLLLEINALGDKADPTPARAVSGSDLRPIPETGEHLFGKLCAPCHTIGVGPRVGPDLLDVSGRRSVQWLAAFIKKPSDFHKRHDPMAEELAQDFPNVRMPDLRLGDTDVADLIIYVDSVSRRVNGIVKSAEAEAGEAAQHDTHNHQN